MEIDVEKLTQIKKLTSELLDQIRTNTSDFIIMNHTQWINLCKVFDTIDSAYSSKDWAEVNTAYKDLYSFIIGMYKMNPEKILDNYYFKRENL